MMIQLELVRNSSDEMKKSTMNNHFGTWIGLTLLVFLLTACEKKHIGTLENYPGEKNGTIKAYFEDGKIYEEGGFVDGVLHGTRKIYFENGQVNSLEEYDYGVITGKFVEYFPSGNIKFTGHYSDGAMNGPWYFYYDSDQLKEMVTFVNNEENGPFKEFYKNGKKKAKGAYEKNLEHGLLELHDSTGTLIRKMNCNLGICSTFWTLDSLSK